MKLLYIANIRLPTEKAHGLQIMQNCEAFAAAGAEVTLWTARRFNTPALSAVQDVWAYYGVRPNFALRRLPCIDLTPLVAYRNDLFSRLVFHIQQSTFILVALILALFTSADVIYSRDPLVVLALSLLKPGRKLAYEVHTISPSPKGRQLQRRTARRAGRLIAMTSRLKDDLVKLAGIAPEKCLVAHDGIRRVRFADLPTQAEARRAAGWPQEAFIVGYVGRLHTMTMDKGVGILVAALAQVEGAALGLVGGPDDMAEALRAQWIAAGLDAERFLYAGQVLPGQVPRYLRAFDVCTMPFPWTEHFAYYASPIKLFEYMAAARAVVASDLPALADVVAHGETALLVPPGDVEALAGALRQLRDDPALRARLGKNAARLALEQYTWDARAAAILHHLQC